VKRPGGKPHGRAHADGRWNAIPSNRPGPATTSAPDRLRSTPIRHDRPATTHKTCNGPGLRAVAPPIASRRKPRFERRNRDCPSGSSTDVDQGTHPGRPDEHGSSVPIRKERDEVTPSWSACTPGARLAANATDGVRKNTTRGGKGRRSVREDETGWLSAVPKFTAMATSSRATGRRPTCAASSVGWCRSMVKRRSPEEARTASPQARTRNGARLPQPTSDRGPQGGDERGCSGMQTRDDGRAGRGRSPVGTRVPA